MLVPFLLNWYANPYHTPIFVAKEAGFYSDLGIDLCILEPSNPSEVTKIIGQGHVPMGLKAMIHCYAARSRGYPIKSIGTLFDEPPTGLITPINKNIKSISDIKGKRIGYVGEFGKVMIDDLAAEAGIPQDGYKTIRTGMNAANAIIQDQVDAAIGISCFQQLEVEDAGIATRLIRIDHEANLGCCCFCSILFIVYGDFIPENKELLTKFMQATIKGVELTRDEPLRAFEQLRKLRPNLDNDLFQNIFQHCLPYFSKDCLNVERDWRKVGVYAKRLGIFDDCNDYQECYSNEFVNINN